MSNCLIRRLGEVLSGCTGRKKAGKLSFISDRRTGLHCEIKEGDCVCGTTTGCKQSRIIHIGLGRGW